MSVNFLKKIWSFPRAKSQRAYHVVDDFLNLPVFFCKAMGIEPFESDRKSGIWFYVYFVLNSFNTMVVFVTGLVFLVIAFQDGEHFLEGCIVMSYVIFMFVGILKLITVLIKKQKLTRLVRQLESCFPSPSASDQELYDVKSYLKRCNIITRGYGRFLTLMAISHSLTPMVIYFFQSCVLHLPDAKQSLPYYDMAPWNWRGSWSFYPAYLFQLIAGYTVTCGAISSDAMIFAVAFQVLMHYDRLAKALREFQIRNNNQSDGANEDLKALQSLIAYHIDILRLTDLMNEVFGVPLLLNFMASSVLVCLVGFQLTFILSDYYFFKQVLFLVAGLVEIYLLCSFSQMLINASEDVSTAAYDMSWTEADTRCRKMLIILLMRAQKPVCLKATIVLDLSMETMSIFLGTSYKFFCAIKTMYE
ncbi:odorant receptor 67a-like [Drosophila takahashii]|uniref:odorant receptor 67a-like n=1 Tax=Drosophila takahashii TaxID=29030 RepID=UPI001CF909C2|nr:odorant receptor 67a-like [Drosophila takahashii]